MIHDLLKKKLDNIAKELGAKVDYRSCEDEYSTCREFTIEYDEADEPIFNKATLLEVDFWNMGLK